MGSEYWRFPIFRKTKATRELPRMFCVPIGCRGYCLHSSFYRLAERLCIWWTMPFGIPDNFGRFAARHIFVDVKQHKTPEALIVPVNLDKSAEVLPVLCQKMLNGIIICICKLCREYPVIFSVSTMTIFTERFVKLVPSPVFPANRAVDFVGPYCLLVGTYFACVRVGRDRKKQKRSKKNHQAEAHEAILTKVRHMSPEK